ncbi:MAG: hypothetical protein AB9917_19205 [Negativicutes bacterium]
MLVDYLSSGCFIGSTIFITGLWFGVFGAYGIYRHNRSFLLFITLSTLITPALTYMFFVSKNSPQYAEMQAMYGAIAGFVIPTLLAEFTITFQKRNEAQAVPATTAAEVRRTSRQAVHAKPAEEPETVQQIVPTKVVAESRKPTKTTARIEPEAEGKVVYAKTVEEARKSVKATKSAIHEEPEAERKVVYAKAAEEARKPAKTTKPAIYEEPEAERKVVYAKTVEEARKPARQTKQVVHAEPAEERKAAYAKAVEAARKQVKPAVYDEPEEESQIVYAKPVEKRKTAPARQMEEPRQATGRSSGTLYKALRYFGYVCTFLLICLFPPYLQKYTNDHIWMFIGSTNIRPSYSLDYTFVIYELILLAIVVSGIEFCRKNIFNDENYDMNAGSYK